MRSCENMPGAVLKRPSTSTGGFGRAQFAGDSLAASAGRRNQKAMP